MTEKLINLKLGKNKSLKLRRSTLLTIVLMVCLTLMFIGSCYFEVNLGGFKFGNKPIKTEIKVNKTIK